MSPSTQGKYRSFDASALHHILLAGHPLAARIRMVLPDASNIGSVRKCRSV
jgi:hypothetical protein